MTRLDLEAIVHPLPTLDSRTELRAGLLRRSVGFHEKFIPELSQGICAANPAGKQVEWLLSKKCVITAWMYSVGLAEHAKLGVAIEILFHPLLQVT